MESVCRWVISSTWVIRRDNSSRVANYCSFTQVWCSVMAVWIARIMEVLIISMAVSGTVLTTKKLTPAAIYRGWSVDISRRDLELCGGFGILAISGKQKCYVSSWNNKVLFNPRSLQQRTKNSPAHGFANPRVCKSEKTFCMQVHKKYLYGNVWDQALIQTPPPPQTAHK